MSEIIITEKLSKHFKKVVAVSDLSINIMEGEIYGFLGLNGAGKTTTIRMLLGLIQPTSGSAYIMKRKIRARENDIWKDIGYMVEVPYSYPELTVRENLEIIRRMRFISDKRAVDRIIEKLQLGEYVDRKAKNLSQGNNQRLGLAKALIHDPKILILDEPTNGLDPAGIVEVRELLTGMSQKHGITIFISSHILSEISRLTTRIGIIHDGKLIEELNSDQLNKLCQKRLLLEVANREAAINQLSGNGYSASIDESGKIEIKNHTAITHPDEIAKMLVYAGLPPTYLVVEEEDLESYFLRTIGMKGGAK
jgi:ABC-2 type transport system ATP-binding protein